MGGSPFKFIGGKLRITSNCTGAVATTALTLIIFGTLFILRYAAPLPSPRTGRVREYYIAAEEGWWDYTPLGWDPMTDAHWNASGVELSRKRHVSISPYTLDDLDLAVGVSFNKIGHRYLKARYVEYESEEFLRRKSRPFSEDYLGVLGPIIRAQVGDLIRVFFLNRASFNASIHPHALFYLKADEGMPVGANNSVHGAHRVSRQFANHEQHANNGADDGEVRLPGFSAGRGDGSFVPPGSMHIYEWQVPARAGPSDSDASSVVWPYHSHVDETTDPNTGLLGAFIITRAGDAVSNEDPRPRGVDREYVLALTLVNEGSSHLLNRTMNVTVAANANESTWQQLMQDPIFQASNVKHAINGYLYNNMPPLSVYINETVRWHVMTIGDEVDLHGIHFHGATLLMQGSRTDSIDLMPGSSRSADMVADVAGVWMAHCHTSKHFKMGMSVMYVVSVCHEAPCVAKRRQ